MGTSEFTKFKDSNYDLSIRYNGVNYVHVINLSFDARAECYTEAMLYVQYASEYKLSHITFKVGGMD